jgi:hypothetical protein
VRTSEATITVPSLTLAGFMDTIEDGEQQRIDAARKTTESLAAITG